MKQHPKPNCLRLLAIALVMAAGGSSNAAAQEYATTATPTALTLGVRTNLLSWATLSPSLGIDLQWGTRWQAGIDGSIGLASTHTHNGKGAYSRLSGIGIEARRYFNAPHRSANLPQGATHYGPYLGIGARHMHVDFKTQRQANALGREGTVNTLGIVVGYSFWLPAGLSIDLAAGAGYLHRYYNRYTWYAPQGANRLVDTRNRGMLGLTHAELSLVYHFNLK